MHVAIAEYVRFTYDYVCAFVLHHAVFCIRFVSLMYEGINLSSKKLL